MSNSELTVAEIVRQTSTTLLDNCLNGINYIVIPFNAKDCFKDIRQSKTKDFIFENAEEINDEVTKIISDRIQYLVAEGFLIKENGYYRSMNTTEMDEFINGDESYL